MNTASVLLFVTKAVLLLWGATSAAAFVGPHHRHPDKTSAPTTTGNLPPRTLSWASPEKKKTVRDFLTTEQLQDDLGYDIMGTLSRQGPIPAFMRLFKAQEYNEAVEKFMAREMCSRIEAMANMDAYFNDPLGWQLARKTYEQTGYKPDYVNAGQSVQQIVLTTIWGIVSTYFIWRIYEYKFLHVDYRDNFWGF